MVERDFQKVISSPVSCYEEGLEFFAGRGMLNQTLKQIVPDFEKQGIDYVVICRHCFESEWLKAFHGRY